MMDRCKRAFSYAHVISILMLVFHALISKKAAMKTILHLSRCYYVFALLPTVLICCAPEAQSQTPEPPRPGVSTPGVRRAMADVHPLATFAVEGSPDWMVVTSDAVWVTSSSADHVVRLDAKTNRPTTIVTVSKPCSGLAAGF